VPLPRSLKRVIAAQMAKWGDAVARAARHRPCACRSDVTENRNPSDPPAPARKKVRRRRRRAAAGAVFPSVLKVEIQNLEHLGRVDPGADERAARLSVAVRELEEREARLAAAESDLEARAERVRELEETYGPTLAAVESGESLDRRERRVGQLEHTLRERGRELDERERDLESRRAVLEADLELREEEVERREDLLAVGEERLEARQRELGVYVSQIQSRLESHWA
jgi:hypothetical protein